MLVEIIVNRTRYIAGKVFDLPEKEAQRLIDGNLAKKIDKKPIKKKPSTEGKTNDRNKEIRQK